MRFRQRLLLWKYWRASGANWLHRAAFGGPAPWEQDARHRILGLPASARFDLLLAAIDRLGRSGMFAGFRWRTDLRGWPRVRRCLQGVRYALLQAVRRRERILDHPGERWGTLVAQLADSLRNDLGDREVSAILREMDRHEAQGSFDPLLRTLRRRLRATGSGPETERAIAGMDPRSRARSFLTEGSADA